MKERRVILDVNFLVQRNAASRLDILRKCGCTFVLLDQLVYEICTSDRAATAWGDVQQTLMPFADAIEVWKHGGVLLAEEYRSQTAMLSPVDEQRTSAVRKWFRSRKTYVPPDLADLAADDHKKREVDTPDAALDECVKVATKRLDLIKALQRASSRGEAVVETVARAFVDDPEGIAEFLRGFRQARQGSTSPNDGGAGLERWFAYQHARSFRALACVYLLCYHGKIKRNKTDTGWERDDAYERFVNTCLDYEYAALLAYADAIATNEIRDLYKLCRWTHGDSKVILTSANIAGASVPEGDISVAAYFAWERNGHGDGHTIYDWLEGERERYDAAWQVLCSASRGPAPKQKPVIRSGGKLMYTSHPSNNAIQAAIPHNPADAVRQRHTVSYAVLSELHDTVWSLAKLVATKRPDLIPFFATGGIPIVFAVMYVLSDRWHFDLTDGSHFHMFPGLAWGGKFDSKTTLDYFVEEFGSILKAIIAAKGTARVLSIDTTNTGNSTRRFVRAMEELCERNQIANPESIVLDVIAIVDRSRAADGSHDVGTVPVQSTWGPIPVLIPEGYRATRQLLDRGAIRFERENGDNCFQLSVTYWTTARLPTEDNPDLLGALAVHEVLGVKTGRTPGRIAVSFDNGLVSEETGGGTPGHRLISLLSESHESTPWRCYKQYAEIPMLTQSERAFTTNAKVWSEAQLRLAELQQAGREKGIESLQKINRLLTGVEVFWLAKQRPIARVMVPKVLASLKSDPAVVPSIVRIASAEEAACGPDAVMPEATISPEAVRFFRRCYPQKAKNEPTGDVPILAKWWMAQVTESVKKAKERRNRPHRRNGKKGASEQQSRRKKKKKT